jgi:cell division protein FtsI (penicillin-binding protein 3)
MQGSLKSRVTGVMVFCLVVAGTISIRAAYLQIWGDSRLEQMSKRQFQSKVLVQPRRGMISDRSGEPLAVNIEADSLAANPEKIQNRRILARLLAKSTDIPVAKILQRLSEKREFVWIKRHLSSAEMNRLKKFRIIDSDGDLSPGLWLVKESQRVYPHGELAAHTLGGVNVDSEGVEGVELWMNEKMRGKVVSVSAIKDALGRPSFIDAVAAKHVQEGENVQLTLDASLQFAVEESLKNAVQKTGSRAGSVIVMNSANGEILALANQPAFNPNEKSVSSDRRRNRVLTDGYEPGSTLKAVLVASALSNGWKLGDRVYGEKGQFKVQGKRIAEAEAKEKFEWLTLKQVLHFSSNIGAAKIGLKLGTDHYLATLKAFGFGGKTGVGFPGEISGRVPARKEWQPLTLANISFGQGILVTPMQMTRAYASFLNGGFLVEPKLLKDADPVAPPKRIMSQKVADEVVAALESVTEEGGTGVKANLDGYKIAGKTGTAQEVDPATGTYSQRRHVASFIGFAVGVEPRLVIFTALDEPQGIYFASETAAPLFHDVMNAVAARFAIPEQRSLASAQMANPSAKAAEKSQGKSPEKSNDMLNISQAHAIEAVSSDKALGLQWQGTTPAGGMIWRMPSLVGLTTREAMEILQGHTFKLEVHGDGVVKKQLPEEGKALADGETIRLSLGEL